MTRTNFNPRTREGCDRIEDDWLSCIVKFQSTHPRGVRRLYRFTGQAGEEISIHAPARGATMICAVIITPLFYFNPRTREGCDFYNFKHKGMITYFNPRTREGCDNILKTAMVFSHYFNPRTREGCDIFQGHLHHKP